MWIDDLAAPTQPANVGCIDHRTLSVRGQTYAEQLRRQGLHPGVPLVAQSADAAEVLLLLYACAWLNCPLLPLNPRTPQPWRRQILARLPARHACWRGGRLQRPAGVDTGIDCDPPQLIIATSGTGGTPKGVMLDAANLGAAAKAANQRLGLHGGDRWLLCLAPFHIGALAIALRCAAAGAAMVLHGRFDPQRLWQQLQGNAITHLSLVPTMLHQLLEVAGTQPPPATLRVVLIGGAPLGTALAQRALSHGWPLCASYGMSECGSQIATRCELPPHWQQGQVGLPLEGLEVVVDAVAGEVGPIRVRGAALMRGYLNPRLQGGDGLDRGWLNTGDLGMVAADGNLQVLGRADDTLISGAENVHPAQVEAVLAGCPGVDEVLVVGEPDPRWGQRLVALFSGQTDADSLAAWSRERLAGAWRPRRFVAIDNLPRGSGGKLDRNAATRLVAAELSRRP